MLQNLLLAVMIWLMIDFSLGRYNIKVVKILKTALKERCKSYQLEERIKSLEMRESYPITIESRRNGRRQKRNK